MQLNMRYIAVENLEECHAVLSWLKSHDSVAGWSKSLSDNMVDALDKHDTIYFYVEHDLIKGSSVKPSSEFIELEVTYLRELVVKNVSIAAKKVLVNGKTYYEEDLNRALSTIKEVK